MTLKSFLCLILLLFVSELFSQDFNNYRPLQSEGTIPADFITFIKDKYQGDKISIDTIDKVKKKRIQKEFILESSYSLNYILRSGLVTFGDPLSVYAKKITDKLLKNDPATASVIRVYTFKSTEVNAFTI